MPLGLGPDLTGLVDKADLLILAGDIGRVSTSRNVSTLSYAEQAADFLGCPAVVVPGNHEYYRGIFERERKFLLEADIPNVTILDRGEAYYIDGSLRILGTTLWTDYAVLGNRVQAMQEAQSQMPDHRLISNQDGSQFSPQNALSEHNKSRTWLTKKLTDDYEGKTLIVTHHAPHSSAAHPMGTTPLSPAFNSDCDDLIAAAANANVIAWIFGHHHWSQALDVGGVRLLSAQLGYPNEDTTWHGPGILSF